MRLKRKRAGRIIFLSGMLMAVLLIFLGNKAVVKTSTNEYCASCHVHPHSTESWKRSTHYDNPRGIQVQCVDCHLPSHGEVYLFEKARTGIRDVWANWFKDSASFNWEAKSQIDHARGHTFESSCIHCHQNNYPLGLTREGREAHLYYERQAGELHCINCHITVGHYDPDRLHAQNTDFGIIETASTELYTEPGVIHGFNNFTEYIPGSAVSFEMIAIPGGTFTMGSPEDEPFRMQDEGPAREVKVSPFFMAKIEVSWDEYLAFFKQTGAQGKSTDTYQSIDQGGIDGISGPTPPYGAPDQGWGKGKMPAMSMTHHAAEVYCQWLTEITGKTYRLPTEAEWEYAARGGTNMPYFFEGDPRRYVDKGIRNKLFGVDTSVINSYIIYDENSGSRSAAPDAVRENPFGLVNMLGNVLEFCSDWYAEDTYSQNREGILENPTGPDSGEEYVVRGGSYRDGAEHVRSASRDFTKSLAWMKTDPQMPKSVWWYSDCFHVGFRVVCEYEETSAD
ncbi:MAG: SUMF1/EgtB/PvdO family nonheme iron enzyme [Bacteroidales bacterium]|nr:SUMF1/EgtB/PvdO family nonheme iron enzyme [Bacteroidales bacterium]